MMIDRDSMLKLVEDSFENRLVSLLEGFANPTELIKDIFGCISHFYQIVPPDLLKHPIKITKVSAQFDISNLPIQHLQELGNSFDTPITLVAISARQCILLDYNYDFENCEILSYKYDGANNERFIIGDNVIQIVDQYETASLSVFSKPTYKELDEAFDHYYKIRARYSECEYLQNIWINPTRMELVKKPEHFMRDSLYSYLRSSLRSHTIKREQNVDVSHPVDIKVTWPMDNRIMALIEIKWLGDSGSTQYRDRRAQRGAEQLIDYLNMSYIDEPEKHFIGYLVVYDARRKQKIEDYYENRSIKYTKTHLDNPYMKYRRFFLCQNNSVCEQQVVC